MALPLDATKGNKWQKCQVSVKQDNKLPISWGMQTTGRTPVLPLPEIYGILSLKKYCGSRIIKGPSYTSGLERVASGARVLRESGWLAEVRLLE